MAPSIRILPESLANKIAAGEVVERPSAVVKELVENSLDAGAREVVVELEAGGRHLVAVRDDGGGMGREDALLAFERHATSKIREEADLERVATLGFRGEALAAIASVSRLTLTTRLPGEPMGTQVLLAGGKLVRVSEMGAPPGTLVSVRDLFFNAPARRKFLRGERVELARCIEALERLAMGHPAAAFSLVHGTRCLLRLPPAPDRASRASELLGEGARPHLIPIRASREGTSLSGLLSAPTLTRASRSCQHFFVNGRPVRDRLLAGALYEVFRSFLPRGRHPVCALFLDLPPEGVDVNVHPTKSEVRFRRPRAVQELVEGALARALEVAARGGAAARATGVPEVRAPESVHRPGGDPPPPRGGHPVAASSEGIPLPRGEETEAPRREPSDVARAGEAGTLPLPLEALSPFPPGDGFSFRGARYLGQLEGCFLLFEHPRGLLVVDQHAAHERILYERFREGAERGEVERQGFLLPPLVELPPGEALRAGEGLRMLGRAGFEVEPFGPGAFRLLAAPPLFEGADPERLLRDLLEVAGEGRGPVDLADNLLARTACRAAVKGGEALRREEAEALLAQLGGNPRRWSCPHGRPVAMVLESGALRRRFLR